MTFYKPPLSCFVVRLNRLFEIRAQAQSKRTERSIPDIDIASIKALSFDVIGTVVDWNTGVISQYVQGRRPGLGLSFVIGIGEALQTRQGSIPDGCGDVGAQAIADHDGVSA